MDINTSNPQNQQPIGAPTKIKEENTKSHYRRRGLAFLFCNQDLDQNIQIFCAQRNRNSQNDTIILEREGIVTLNPYKITSDIKMKAKRVIGEENDPHENDHKEEREALEDDDNIIVDPTTELDDSYKPGHADRESNPPIKKEKPKKDPEENTETH
ncbi:hypothetical protein M3O96_17990 [Aquiflexum sp. TKW24L]|uniref:hypothetical protein n=1 Tax=Aquiflexum sp. TKW24L TaxID=2942212 RepID=UPI0020C00D82|nr:hypothetical protein [Aquiflexum sp. TKW24L]MCL6261001.1 hypothetical protein [Aquiflexum sp. TKW24L]